ncbi:MAG TPA: glycosyltransferase family 2 protein [Abditibacteriaceae bacterium]|jgi:hypothetical protein
MLSILVVNWNTRDYLRACLHSLRETCAEIEHEVIVVDNASHDGSATMVRAEFPDVKLFASEENTGFARGNNLAYGMSRGEWVWLLNPDVEVQTGAPQKLIEFLQQHPRAGGVASALIDARDGKPQRSCRTFPVPAALWSEATRLAKFFPRSRRYGFYRMGWWNYRDTRRVEQPMASSFLLRRRAIEQITAGSTAEKPLYLFDEQFPIFFNDVDLCWRLVESGWEIWYRHDALVRHWGGAATSQARPEMIEESHRALRRFYRKHFRALVSPPVFAVTLALVTVSGRWRVAAAQHSTGRDRTAS